jgi:photosystem II stability/assembly factor-like uncharacterized protein
MKYLLAFLIYPIILLWTLPITSLPQSGWINQSGVTPYTLNDVFFTDINTGTAVGESGTIIQTVNGGTSWTSQTIPGWPELFGVCFTDADTGMIVGDFGLILRTTNGGANWVNTAPSWIGGVPFKGLSFINGNIGTVVGGYQLMGWYGFILRTTDGGFTWVDQSIDTLNQELIRVSFTDANTGTAVGFGGTIIRTTNGGQNWIKQISGTPEHIWDVSFTDTNLGITVGFFNVLRTTNGGLNWTTVSTPISTLFKGVFLKESIGTAVGYHGTIIRTTDGGVIWTTQNSGTSNELRSVFFVDSLNGVAVGIAGTILMTLNGGVSTIENENNNIPAEFILMQNYPNPFNSSTTFSFSLPSQSFVSLKVFDLAGRVVATVVSETNQAGNYSKQWDASNLSSGIYFYTLQAGSFSDTKKIVLLK